MAASLLAMFAFRTLFPPPPPQKAPAVATADEAKKGGEPNKPGEKAHPPVVADDKSGQPAAPKADQQAAINAKAAEAAEAPAPPAAAPDQPGQLAASEAPVRYVTIGSLDFDSDYRMLVTLTSAGAAIERVEMASSRFRDQHDWTGYLGELALKDVRGGAEVRVVGAGTPAARATADGKSAPLEPGDVIVGIGASQPKPVNKSSDLTAALAKLKPRDEITLQVSHGEAEPQPRTIRLVRRPFAVVRPEADNFHLRGAALPANFVDRPSFLLTLASVNGANLLEKEEVAKQWSNLLETGTWELVAHDETSATFRRSLPELKLELEKKYVLEKAPADKRDDPAYPAYHLQFFVQLRNTGTAKQQVAYRLDGPTGMPVEGWWYTRKISQRWGGGGMRDVAVRVVGSQEHAFDDAQIAKGNATPIGNEAALAYVGVDGQYFAAMMLPKLAALDDIWFDSTEAVLIGSKLADHDLAYSNVTCRLTRGALALEPNGTWTDEYRVFLGPKRPALLAQYYAANDKNYSLKDILYYGWPIFGAVAQAMLAILHFFYSIVGNYGIAIILLTVLVRSALFPLSYKQTKSMARIQALKPEMDRINEKYKNDLQKKSQATQELYRKHNINPMAGCLPVFLQLPIFIGLYRALSVDVELRQSPLFGSAIKWCSNLAAPDMLWNWSAIMPDFVTSRQGFFGLGQYLNLFPLITVVLFLVTQKMTMPDPTNEQAVVQQKMMKYMTVFMGLMFYKVPSGLCLYFITSSLWGIAERKLLPKAKPAEASPANTPSWPRIERNRKK